MHALPRFFLPSLGIVALGLTAACGGTEPNETAVSVEAANTTNASDVLYDDTLRDFGLELSDAAIAALNLSAEINVDRPTVDAVFIHAGVRYDVELKLKGQFGSFRRFDEKPAFKVKFKGDVEFMGVTTLTLNNLVQDWSMLAQVTAWDVSRSLGVPAPRASFVRLQINGENFGVYVNAESVSKAFLERHSLNKKGSLFEPLFGGFVLDEGDASAWSKLATLRTAIATQDADVFFFGPNAPFDADKLTTVFAAEVATDQVDGYVDAQNNYRLHVDPVTNRWTMIPGTPDRAFERDVGPFATSGELAKKCLASSLCASMYRTKLDAAVALVASPTTLAKFDAREALIAAAAAADPRKETSNADRAAARDAQREMMHNAVARLQTKLSGTPVDLGGRSYIFFTGGADFATAVRLCAEAGRSLSVFETDTERLLVHAKAAELFGRSYWAGATDRHSEGTWRWESNGAPIAFPPPWRGDEPNGGLRESCAEVMSEGGWNDLDCGDARPFICEP